MSLLECVIAFSTAMLHKLWIKEHEGFTGWDRLDWGKRCKEKLVEHVARAKTKEDWVDVANFAMFMWRMSPRKKKP